MGGGSKTTTTNTNEQATTVPQMPTYAADPVKNYFSGISNYQQSDPYQFVTPANSLQTDAFSKADGLFQTSGLYDSAANAAQGVMNANPTTYTAGQTQASLGSLQPAQQATAQGYQAPSLGQAAQVQGPNLGSAAQSQWGGLGQASQANASLAGPAATAGVTNANAANAGQAQGVNLTGYSAPTLGSAAQAAGSGLGGTANTATAASLLDNFQAYQNPALAQLRDTTLGSMDENAARVRAAQQAQFARSGAFGGSRAAITQAQTEGDLARERGLAEANLNSQAWNAATQLSGQDAAMRQQTGLFNADAQNQRDVAGAGLAAANNQFNAGQQNQFGLAQFGANTDAARYGADAANQGSLFNAGAQNDFSLANAGFQQQANLTNAGAANNASQFNAGQQNTLAAQNAQLGTQTNLANMDAANQFALSGAQMGLQNNQFNAGAQNDFAIQGAQLGQQAALANQQATNQFGLAGADMAQQAAQFGANAQNTANLANMQAANTYGLANFDAQNQANQFNAGQANQLGQFNASTMNDATAQNLARQLQGAGLLGDIGTAYGNNYRADLGTQADLGNMLYGLQSQYDQAPLQQLQNVGNLLNPGYINAVSGQTVTGQNSGVSKEQTSGGLFNSLLGIGSLAVPFIPK